MGTRSGMRSVIVVDFAIMRTLHFFSLLRLSWLTQLPNSRALTYFNKLAFILCVKSDIRWCRFLVSAGRYSLYRAIRLSTKSMPRTLCTVGIVTGLSDARGQGSTSEFRSAFSISRTIVFFVAQASCQTNTVSRQENQTK